MIRSMKILLTFVTLLLAACASTPSTTDPKTIEPSETAAAPDASSQTAADRRFAEETRGYKQVERNGKTYYCRSERASGSNLRTTTCFTETELRSRFEAAERYRQQRKASACAPADPRCGGAGS